MIISCTKNAVAKPRYAEPRKCFIDTVNGTVTRFTTMSTFLRAFLLRVLQGRQGRHHSNGWQKQWVSGRLVLEFIVDDRPVRCNIVLLSSECSCELQRERESS